MQRGSIQLASGKEIHFPLDNSALGCCLNDLEGSSPKGTALLSPPGWEEIARNLRLSGRELSIVRGMFDDLTESAIAEQLHISSHTVHSHIERLYHKLGVSGRVKLILRVMERHIALTQSPNSLLPPLCANFDGGRCPLRGKRL